MKKKYQEFCNYLGSFLGFIGALFMAFAMVPIQTATQYDCNVTGKTPEQIMQLLKNCGYHFVGLKYPCINKIGLTLLILGFFIQFLPAIPKIYRFITISFFEVEKEID